MNKYFTYQSSQIHYRSIGNGKPVILLHGFGEDGEIWNNQASYLQEKFQLLIPDLPGSGKSELINDMSMEGMAEVIKEIIELEVSEIPRSGGFKGAACPVIGHSMGGYIALALTNTYYNYVSALGLFHSSAFADSEEKKATRQKGIEFIKANGAFEFLKTAIPNLFAPASKEEKPELIAELVAAAHNFSAPALVSYYEAMMKRFDRTDVLKNSKVPVLFIMGKYDVAVPAEDTLKQCHLPEKSYIHLLQHTGHMGMLEEPEVANRYLEEFLLDIYA
jgi:pimeloyl-ACP methyl ester carboxylesterase